MWKFFTKYGEEKKLLVPSLIAYGTSLPTTPIDGQEAILVDSITAPTYEWRFRYNAQSTSAYKWEYIGGTEAYILDGSTRQNTANSTWQFIAGVPQFTLPRAGQYSYRYGGLYSGNNAVPAYIAPQVVAGASWTPPVKVVIGGSLASNSDIYSSAEGTDIANGVTRSAADLIRLAIYSANFSNTSWSQMFLSVKPIRVS